VNAISGNHETALHFAIRCGYFDVLAELLLHMDANLNAANNDGETALPRRTVAVVWMLHAHS
jgi:hypothetical protein